MVSKTTLVPAVAAMSYRGFSPRTIWKTIKRGEIFKYTTHQKTSRVPHLQLLEDMKSVKQILLSAPPRILSTSSSAAPRENMCADMHIQTFTRGLRKDLVASASGHPLARSQLTLGWGFPISIVRYDRPATSRIKDKEKKQDLKTPMMMSCCQEKKNST
ncbi:hypothetical protein EYF80_001912 [Liparis tanakae]|uniref:Uncharacterized protein n=1 Tax=Liparis tanakae TaxID=230148 RepID=A0A4Z2JE59_9TELE|nr:hypothetical protein EYF80_001912 [Liparis tanakae]